MRLTRFQRGKVFILYDAHSVCDATSGPQIGPETFTPEYWRAHQAVTGEAPGRGASLFIETGNEHWVLRPYRRGGLVARFCESRYLWLGAERSRAFRELRLTAYLHERGLPVPRPIGACVWRHGLAYEAALITVRLPGAQALAERLPHADDSLLVKVGTTVRRFHDAGLDHVDLNARNLLVDTHDRLWLIDLDRCRLRRPGAWREANLERLERSLVKFGAPQAMAAIRQGYDGVSASN
ncbi:3-deoxy-D-manno-octulosonic acid kinase [Litchfieldella qijiaojingensis]|uniref:3-deoxy-D-manno-octulosonic acid kinase n=1 Tax=Litchfieldella qijiaojingensis TaxID=980347 RepID=A0ABQ2YJF3_9GAMM|nr:3-deoxy-D-manno-octulosonic acid kinase [Halomonas qijiaojingensis]GGX83880.1 3-deoxy-D-manno-octulosonic acid kinase [Halomonas qijiaojingensis]